MSTHYDAITAELRARKRRDEIEDASKHSQGTGAEESESFINDFGVMCAAAVNVAREMLADISEDL